MSRGSLLRLLVCSTAVSPGLIALGQGAPVPGGTVTGHVLCSDTGRAARLAGVLLVPVVEPHPAARASSSPAKPQNPEKPQSWSTVVYTGFDGAFTMTGVHPGNYYVVAEKPGYLSPLAQISREQLDHPSPETAARMKALLVPVSVAANSISSVTVSVLRGASLSGAVRFDDGEPVTMAPVALQRRDALGKWLPFSNRLRSMTRTTAMTDDQGRYRFSSLPEGEYRVAASINFNAHTETLDALQEEASGMMTEVDYTLTVFYPDALRPSEGKPVKLHDGEDAAAVDIEVPLSRLHSLAGTVVEAGTGHVVNDATVDLLDPVDRSELITTGLRAEDNTFVLPYVPEGEYILEARGARDVRREEVAAPPGAYPPTFPRLTTLRSFGDAEQPLVLHTDRVDLVIAVPLTPTTASSIPAPLADSTPPKP